MQMKRLTMLLVVAVVPLVASVIEARQMSPEDRQGLRSQIEARYDVVPLSDGIALRPKTRIRDVRLVEISDAGIAINGEPASGRDLRERLGDDARHILRLSYLSADDRRSLFAPQRGAPEVPPEAPVEAPAPGSQPDRTRSRQARGDRVRVFGNVTVERDEAVRGQVVAVMGSVRIDGEVGDQVVAVLGSVDLGPEAVVGGDIVSVGGVVRRAPTAQVRGGVTEVALFDGGRVDLSPWITTWTPFYMFNGFGALPRLIGSSIRLGLLLLLALIALVLARPTVERSAARLSDNPLKSLIVGLLAQALVIPVLILTSIVLALTIVGIPLVFILMPFVMLLLVLMAIAGFSGTAVAVGQWTRGRFGIMNGSPFLDVIVGVIVIVLPLMLGRVLALAGWPVTPVVVLLVAAGFAVELLAWSSGFGAVLTNMFSHWQAKRVASR
jgi:hypothetical protein